jgi:TonB family protein
MSSAPPAATPPAAATPARPIPVAPPCVDDAAVGGQVRPPRKLKDSKPVYPEQLRASKVGGLVVVEGILAGNGAVTNMTVVETPHPDLGQAVMDAIGRWVFDGTLLNCQPVDVRIRVNAKFEIE